MPPTPTAPPTHPGPPPGASRRHGLSALVLAGLLGGLVGALAGSPPATAAMEPAGRPPLARLAVQLSSGPAPLRADLAGAAAAELAAAYGREVERARAELQHHPGDHDLRRWMRAVEDLAAEMTTLAIHITPLTPVEVRIGPDDGIQLIIEGRSVLVSSPRPHAQQALERRVIERFCRLNLCTADLLDAAVPPEALPAPAGVAPLWSFSRAGPACSTDDGLEFQFDSQADLRAKRSACAAVVAELRQLADAIVPAVAAGAHIDWNALMVDTTPDPGWQRLRLNRAGNTLQVRAPALLATPELFTALRPWLAARVRAERYHVVILHADRLMAALIGPGY